MGNKAEIHVACNIDSNYVKYCAVMLTSLLENNSDSCVHVHVIAASLPRAAKACCEVWWKADTARSCRSTSPTLRCSTAAA